MRPLVAIPGRLRGAARRIGEAFTLIEVLLGILILALALLGLGAVVPVVVRAQRQAADATQGAVVARAAEAYLRTRADLNRLSFDVGTGNPPFRGYGWGVWLLDHGWSPDAGPQAFLWDPPTSIQFDPAIGDLVLVDAPAPPAVLKVADRLWPARDSGGGDPQFIWDVIARRVQTGRSEPGRIQVALFVRRVDLNIRVPSGINPATGRPISLYDVLTGRAPFAADWRLPVAQDPSGFPTNTGVGPYAQIRTADVAYDYIPNRVSDRIRLVGVPLNVRTLITRAGQRLVDNLGNTYTVRGLYEADLTGNTILVDPPIPSWVPTPLQNPPVERSLRQIAFTPQIPAAVTVLTLTPQDSK